MLTNPNQGDEEPLNEEQYQGEMVQQRTLRDVKTLDPPKSKDAIEGLDMPLLMTICDEILSNSDSFAEHYEQARGSLSFENPDDFTRAISPGVHAFNITMATLLTGASRWRVSQKEATD
jgi:hypothetical protein